MSSTPSYILLVNSDPMFEHWIIKKFKAIFLTSREISPSKEPNKEEKVESVESEATQVPDISIPSRNISCFTKVMN